MVVEKLITRAKNAKAHQAGDASTVHARRQVSRLIKDRAVVSDLFSTIAEKVAERPGGYTRIVRLGQRKGDGAELAVIELVDFNTGQEPKEKAASAKKEKREKKPKKAGKPTGEPKGEARTATVDAERKVAGKKKGASQESDTQESP
jgi:large subunit ribosomal protein L17